MRGRSELQASSMEIRLRTCHSASALGELFEFNGSVDGVALQLVGNSQLEVYDRRPFVRVFRCHKDVKAFLLVVSIDARIHCFDDQIECLYGESILALQVIL